MKSFSDYLRKLKDRNTKPKEGFVSIKKKDLEEIDKLLKKPTKPIKEDVGLTKSDIESYKYSPENPHKENDNPFHQAYLEKTKTMPHRTVIGGIVDKEQARRDRKEFGHHHQLNTAHEREGNQFKYTVLDRDAPPEYKAHTHEPLKEYTRSSHNLNRYLVNKHLHPEETKKDESAWVRETSEAHDKALGAKTHHPGNALTHPTIVHSGVGHEFGKTLKHTNIGEKVHFPAYTSTSTHPALAHMFADMRTDNVNDVPIKHIVHFHLPAGYTKGRHIENITHTPWEHEMLLHKDQTFKKVGHAVERSEGNHSIYEQPHEVHHHHFVPVSNTEYEYGHEQTAGGDTI